MVRDQRRRELLIDARELLDNLSEIATLSPWIAASVYALASSLPEPERDSFFQNALSDIQPRNPMR